jgi:hypothetical protein
MKIDINKANKACFDEILESMRVHYFYFGVQTRVVPFNKTNLTLDHDGWTLLGSSIAIGFIEANLMIELRSPRTGPSLSHPSPDPYPFRRNE